MKLMTVPVSAFVASRSILCFALTMLVRSEVMKEPLVSGL